MRKTQTITQAIQRSLLLLLAGGLLVSCSGQGGKPPLPVNGQPNIADLNIVDCLLPGQIRSLGTTKYMTPRRPVYTTAADCRIRGGEYVAYDRADYKTALAVWMPSAEAGDADAQANVGEIFERGLGGSPNYEAAAIWYKKAAEQGNARGQFNLGTLYEQGLGVEKDKLQALNLYRQAWGMPKDDVIYQSAAANAEQELRDQLQKTLAEKETQIKLLNNQMKSLQAQVGATAQNNAAQQELDQLKDWVKNLQAEQLAARNEFDALPRMRQPKASTAQRVETSSGAEAVKLKDMNFGKYYALIIANQHYDNIDDLITPYADAKRAKEILEEEYGFKVTLLLDANNTSVMKAINALNEMVGEDDNLLIFYAGHGSRINAGELETGYWLPTNASPPPDDTFWVPNEFVTRHLARIKAKRIMVVADSCYAGLLSSAPGYLFMDEKVQYTDEYLKYKLPKKSRLLLSSGGDQPVLDNAGRGHSVFARAFLDSLENAGPIISAPELYLKVKDEVGAQAKTVGFEQMPEFKAIKGAGHEVGDFFFVRKT